MDLDKGIGEGGKGRRKGGGRRFTYRNCPSVRTLRSCRMNQTPMAPVGSVSLKALTQRLPMRLRVNMPLGAERGSAAGERRCWCWEERWAVAAAGGGGGGGGGGREWCGAWGCWEGGGGGWW